MENKMNIEVLDNLENFNTLEDSEMIEVDGGGLGTAILIAGGLVFLAGSLRGCAAEDKKNGYK